MDPRTLFARDGAVATAWITLDSSFAAEVAAHAGYDAVTVDVQHGAFGLDTAIRLLHVLSAGPALSMARCSANDPVEIGKLLDAGAQGLICPLVDTADDCAAFVAACRYPPAGGRSYGPSRGLLPGAEGYLDRAATVMTWAMVETRAALDDLAAIVAVDGLDGVFVGPNDLSFALGRTPVAGSLDPEVAEAVGAVVDAAHAAGRLAGIFATSGELARGFAERGFDLVAPGNDAGLLRAAAVASVAEVRGAARPGSGGR